MNRHLALAGLPQGMKILSHLPSAQSPNASKDLSLPTGLSLSRAPRAKAVVFDMDGTITDSREAYLQTLLEVLERIGRPRTREEVAELIVPSIIGTVRRVLSGDEEMIQRAELMIRKLVVKRGDGIRLCPGVIGALARLEKKYMLGLLTASDRSLVDATLGRLEVLRIFNQVVTVNLELPTKDERFRHLLGLLGAEPSESVFVGDTVNDIETARRNGSLSVAVFNPCSWSWPRKEVLMDAKPDIMIESLEELPPWLGC